MRLINNLENYKWRHHDIAEMTLKEIHELYDEVKVTYIPAYKKKGFEKRNYLINGKYIAKDVKKTKKYPFLIEGERAWILFDEFDKRFYEG